MVRYSLKAKLGQFYTNKDETAVLYEQGDFLFLAGQADMALLADYRDFCKPDYRILISEEASWQGCLSSCPALSPFTRYAFKDEADFDDKVLKNIVEQLSEQFCMEAIDQRTYQELAQEEWSQDLQGNFATFKDFQEGGAFGFVIRKGQEIVAGVSTGKIPL
ncbi:MAG: GNAT family N-acetyltransferase [Streptococcus anginosus]